MDKLYRLIDLDLCSLMRYRWRTHLLTKNKELIMKFLDLIEMKPSAFFNIELNKEFLINKIAYKITEDVIFKGCYYPNITIDGINYYLSYERCKFGDNYFEYSSDTFIDYKIEEEIFDSIKEEVKSYFGSIANNYFDKDIYHENEDMDYVMNDIVNEKDKKGVKKIFNNIVQDIYLERTRSYSICSNLIDEYINKNYNIESGLYFINNNLFMVISIILRHIDVRKFPGRGFYIANMYSYSYIRPSYNSKYKYEIVFIYTGDCSIVLSSPHDSKYLDEMVDILQIFKDLANIIGYTL